MNKSTKGAFAAAAAGVLLLGGAGSLAYWTSDGEISGTTINSGHLALGGADCDGWMLDGGAAFVNQKLVPGDSLTQVCEFIVTTEGDHLVAAFAVVEPSFGSGSDEEFTRELDASAVYTVNGTAVVGATAAVTNDDVVKATITVDFDGSGASDDSNDVAGFTATLDDITITATQAHDAS